MVIFADGADKASILELNKNPLIEGFTTNPSLLRKAEVTNYKEFALDLLTYIDKPVSFEVIADDQYEIYRQALEIHAWGKNVYVKIPIVNTKGESMNRVIKELSEKGIKLNVTAIMTTKQVKQLVPNIKTDAFISVFAGRIADTGINPLPIMKSVLKLIKTSKLIWASPREVLNIYQAEEIGCHVITCTPDLIKKLSLRGKDLTEYSRETVQMFYRDANESGLKL